jgi:cytochrome c oxidase subunit 2
MLNYLGLPAQASTHAGDIDQMISIVHWLMLVMFVGWGLYFVYVLFRFRKGANPKANYEGAHGTFAKGTEIAVVIAEMVILLVFAIPAWATRVAQLPAENQAVVVRVIAEQFAWNVQYAGPDGKFGRTDVALVSADNPIGLDRRDPDAKDDVTTINQLNIPVDRPILVQLSSKDVIHSFAIYEMRVKQDVVPGLRIPVWFIPNKVGAYEIACSQLCGLGHFRMRGFVTVQSAADFTKWMDDQEKELRPAVATTPAP